jgi:hypothetical protein
VTPCSVSVAAKVLHAALADDEAFLRRFRAEARAAAALNHPNIMAVYDWGQDPDVPYLITEYLGGGSLRALLNQSGPLTPAQALMVGLEAARGLEYAHRRGFVHRDIKPANLLFDEDARLRIADFGLARALAEATWTEPVGAVLGTAKYASPEQARGESLDGRSDVYSLALVVVEAATGRVPFAADTTIGTLMARVDRDTPVPDELGALAGPLRWAGAADPARRPDAAEFGAALMAAASAYDRPAPLALAGARLPDDVVVIDLDPTERVPRPGEAPAPTGDPAPNGPGGPGVAAVAGLAGVAGAVTGAAGAAGFAGLAATPPVAPLGVGGPTVPGGVPGPAPVADLVDRADPDGADATPPAEPGSAGPPVPGGADVATDPAVDAAGGVGPVAFAPGGGAVRPRRRAAPGERGSPRCRRLRARRRRARPGRRRQLSSRRPAGSTTSRSTTRPVGRGSRRGHRRVGAGMGPRRRPVVRRRRSMTTANLTTRLMTAFRRRGGPRAAARRLRRAARRRRPRHRCRPAAGGDEDDPRSTSTPLRNPPVRGGRRRPTLAPHAALHRVAPSPAHAGRRRRRPGRRSPGRSEGRTGGR